MNKDKMIEFLIDNESPEDLKESYKKLFTKIETAKELIFVNYFDVQNNNWTNKTAQQVYYILDFNNNEVE